MSCKCDASGILREDDADQSWRTRKRRVEVDHWWELYYAKEPGSPSDVLWGRCYDRRHIKGQRAFVNRQLGPCLVVRVTRWRVVKP